jgi:catechol 2,3-dioxygenase-like lactoylglutathione lyase family enzyme
VSAVSVTPARLKAHLNGHGLSVFDHVEIRVSDRQASERFYDTVLGTLGLERREDDEVTEWGDFSVASVTDERPVTRRLHVAFFAPSRDVVDEFWRAGVEAGYRDDGPPGPRPQYSRDYYGGFLLDPDGNSVEAVHHGSQRDTGAVDHLWIRVADVDASRRFYERVAPHVGFRVNQSSPEHVHVPGRGGSFSLVAGAPTEHAHFAFPAASDAAVGAFHEALVGAGYRDNGAPGERPHYHPGYYGAFVLDPDGNNIELVNHNR